MLGFLSILGFVSYQPNFPISLGSEPPSDTIKSIKDIITQDTTKTVYVFQVPQLHESDLSDASISGISGYVYPAETVLRNEYSNIEYQTVADFAELASAISSHSSDPWIVVQASSVEIHKDYTNYWVPAVWNSFLAIVIFIALCACSITYFANISVQTKFAKRD